MSICPCAHVSVHTTHECTHTTYQHIQLKQCEVELLEDDEALVVDFSNVTHTKTAQMHPGWIPLYLHKFV